MHKSFLYFTHLTLQISKPKLDGLVLDKCFVNDWKKYV